MESQGPSASQAQVEAFGRRHRTGLVTLTFTDLAGSTELKQRHGDAAALGLIEQHHAAVRDLLRQFAEAEEIGTAGDSFFLVFARPSDAVRFALRLHARLQQLAGETGTALRDRVGIHAGEVFVQEDPAGAGAKSLHGLHVDTAARVMSLGQGGQVLMTRFVFDNARQSLKGEEIAGVGALSWLNHGWYRLKGIDEPVEICEVRTADAGPVTPPTSSEKAERVTVEGEPVLGWRPAVGQMVGRTDWVLEEKLGEGGFGEVWVGRHRKLKERRVFKFCFRADRIRSLKRELTLFRLLKERIGEHPNIVRLHEVYFDEPPYFLEEDYVEGRDLARWCEAQGGVNAVPLETRLEIVAQVADALQAAHECGVIHRDVKPGNVLIAECGVRSAESGGSALARSRPSSVSVKLTDFGVGQVVSQECLAGVTRAGFTQTMLSTSSSQTGTQLYLAPELLAGEPATTRSDIYSLGVVLYQLVVGAFNRPLTSDWTEDIADPLLRDDLRHCVAGKPADRFAGAGQLAKNLRAWEQRKAEMALRQAEQAARELAERRAAQRHRLAVLAGGAAVLLLLLAITLGYGIQRAEKQRRRAEAYLYDADMILAGQALQQNNLGRALSFLNLHRPAKTGQRDLRGWEWRYLWEKCRSDELATIGQHDGIVQSVAVFPDGKWVASGGYDGLVKIWALASGAAGGRWVTNLQLGGGPVSSVAFSPDGRWLAARSWTNGFALLRAAGWQRELTVTNTETGPMAGSLAFSADSRLLAVGGEVWSLDTRTRLRTLPCKAYNWGQPGVAWLPHSQTLAGLGRSNGLFRVSLFDVRSTSPDATVSVIPLRAELGTRLSPGTLTFSPDGKHLAVGCIDGTIRIHAANDWRQVRMLTNHTEWVGSLAFSQDGQWLASASADHSIRVWRTRDWQETATLRGHLEEVWAVAFTPDGQRLVTGSKDHSVRLWPAAGRSKPVEEVSVSGEGTTFFGLSGVCPFRVGPSNILTLWDGQTLQVRQRIYPITNVLGYRPSPDGRLLLKATAEGGLWLTDLAQGAVSPPVCLQTNGARFRETAFSDQAKWLAVADGDALRVWNLKHQPRRPASALAAGNFWGLRFSRDERLLGAVTGPIWTAETVLVWDVASGKELVRFQPHRDGVTALDFSPDGTVLATASYDNTCKLFDLRRHKFTTLRGQLLAPFSVCFSPDGRRLAAGLAGGSIVLWDLETGREVLVLKTHRAGISAVRFHPSGDSLLSTDGDTLHLWRVPSWDEIQAIEKAQPKAP
jgi:WD40 repeat protein/class 3 adenylate cyclase